MEAGIGKASGIIWRYLEEHSGATLSKLRRETKLSDELLLMGLGWLAREGKLNLLQEKKTLKVSLKGR
jgi:hypothetical protein